MFQSYYVINYCFASKCYELKLVDSDFQETIKMQALGALEEISEVIAAIIQVYSKRNLNVAYNLLLFMKYMEKKFDNNFYSLNDQIYWHKKFVKDFDKYLPDINKYLSLI